MVRSSLIFLLIALLCLLVADLEITTLDPWLETGRMAKGAITPFLTDTSLREFFQALLNTLVFGFSGIFLAVFWGSILTLFFHKRPVRMLCAAARSVHELFWAFLLIPLVGLNPICGVLAIAIPYSGVFAKVYAEIYEETDKTAVDSLPENISAISRFLYGIYPLIRDKVIHYTTYRFECALRSSTVLGFIGLPTLGFYLETAFREGLYSEAFFILFAFYLVILSLKYWFKPALFLPYTVLSLVFVSKEITFSQLNIKRFLYEVVPWPVRRDGFYDGTGSLRLNVEGVLQWFAELLGNEAIPGALNTVILTQVALVGAGIFALFVFPALSRRFLAAPIRQGVNVLMVMVRTTPEYIFAYVFILLWGPSMLPAIIAIVLHNGAITAHLMSGHADQIRVERDDPQKAANKYFYNFLPRIYGQFLAFLFYRWEVMMKESSILGILGIYTLGFYVDSALDDDKLDKALLLIVVTAVLNVLIDSISQLIRKRGWLNNDFSFRTIGQ